MNIINGLQNNAKGSAAYSNALNALLSQVSNGTANSTMMALAQQLGYGNGWGSLDASAAVGARPKSQGTMTEKA
jgi:hypothetical protein